MFRILTINGPNLNMLGIREKSIYGSMTLQDINSKMLEASLEEGLYIEFFQSNVEGELIDRIHQAYQVFDGIIMNPGAYSHYSVAIRDAIEAVQLPVIEVHLSNIYRREQFRRHSVVSEVCIGQISGLGYHGYIYALKAINEYLKGVK